jgi:hypothetical protein
MIWDSLNRDFSIVKSSEFSLLSNGQLSGKPTLRLTLRATPALVALDLMGPLSYISEQ